MPTFKIQGQIYHRAGSMLPMPDSDPKYLQIYFMGTVEDQVNQRCRIDSLQFFLRTQSISSNVSNGTRANAR